MVKIYPGKYREIYKKVFVEAENTADALAVILWKVCRNTDYEMNVKESCKLIIEKVEKTDKVKETLFKQ